MTDQPKGSLWTNPQYPPPAMRVLPVEQWDFFGLAGQMLRGCLAKYSVEQQRKVAEFAKSLVNIAELQRTGAFNNEMEQELSALRLEVAAWRALAEWTAGRPQRRIDSQELFGKRNVAVQDGVGNERVSEWFDTTGPAAIDLARKLQLIPAKPDAESAKDTSHLAALSKHYGEPCGDGDGDPGPSSQRRYESDYEDT